MKRDYTRKEFIGLGLGLASFAVAGCGDDGAGSEETGGPGSTGPGTGADDDGAPTSLTGADDDDGGNTTGGGPGSTGPADSTGPGPADSTGPGEGSSSGGDGSSSGGAAVECGNPDIQVDLHAHPTTIPEEDVIAGVEATYTMGGGHTHELTLTADDFAALAAGETIVVTSGPGGDGHMHQVTITCA